MIDLEDRLKNFNPAQRELFMKRIRDMERNKELQKIVLTLNDGDSKEYTPLFCLHPPLGAVGYMVSLVRHLNPKVPVYGIQSPAFSGTRGPFDNMEEMADYYLQSIRSIQPNGPYQLLGHSSGSYIVYEMAQQLMKQKQEVPLLIIIDQLAPLPSDKDHSIMDIFKRDDLFESVEALFLTAWAVSLVHGVPLSFTQEELIPLSVEKRYDRISEFLKEAGFIPKTSDRSMVKSILEMYACHSKADEMYEKKFKNKKLDSLYGGHSVLFRSTQDTIYEGCDIVEPPDTSEFSNWNQFCSGPIDVIGVPDSNHITIIMEPCVKFLGEKLQGYLEKFGKQ